MNKVNTESSRIEKVRARLDVLPPSAGDFELPPQPPVKVWPVDQQPTPKQVPSGDSKPVQAKPVQAKVASAPVPVTPVTPTETQTSRSQPTAAVPKKKKRKKNLPETVAATAAGHPVQPESQTQPAPAQSQTKPLSGKQQLSAITTWHEEVEAEPETFYDRVHQFLSGWATSFVVHTLLLILLAVFTIGMKENPGIALSASDSDEIVPNMEAIDISVDFSEIEEMSADLAEEDTPQDFADEFSEETLEADQFDQQLEDWGVSTLSGAGIDSRQGDGGNVDGGQGEGLTGKSADFFGAEAAGTRFVFVIDCSGSMAGERWRRAKYELQRSINELTEDQEFCILLYNTFTAVMGNGNEVELVKATEDNRELAFQWLDRQYPDGGTYPRQAMALSLQEQPDAIFLLSDGEIQDNTYEYLLRNNKREDAESGNYKIPVHTIALLSTFGQRVLKAIADDNEGTFTRVGN